MSNIYSQKIECYQDRQDTVIRVIHRLCDFKPHYLLEPTLNVKSCKILSYQKATKQNSIYFLCLYIKYIIL